MSGSISSSISIIFLHIGAKFHAFTPKMHKVKLSCCTMALHMGIYTASRGFPATARLLFSLSRRVINVSERIVSNTKLILVAPHIPPGLPLLTNVCTLATQKGSIGTTQKDSTGCFVCETVTIHRVHMTYCNCCNV